MANEHCCGVDGHATMCPYYDPSAKCLNCGKQRRSHSTWESLGTVHCNFSNGIYSSKTFRSSASDNDDDGSEEVLGP